MKPWVAAALARGEVTPITHEAHDGTPVRCVALTDDLPALSAGLPAGKALRILSPFDPALRDRKRAERLFGFHYRIEVFVPAPKRQYGYYVFPVLEGARLVGRIDTKAIRAENRMAVTGFWPEPGIKLTRAREAALGAELQRLAGLAGVERVDYADDWRRECLG